ncbi:hypothetical protein OS493_033743 [Desmophyllum pertusum]|uniref:Uncharacterized protein n=1 Tax=Desmophyllum pertusum TaxID=174260 RepID=A0A9W9Z7R9_9CNID|nr:hypothetical protein OS493_033743 [Desmophyllum pertusum]
MYISAICVILCVFHIHSAHAGVITKRLKLSQVSATQNDACPPGVWTFATGKRSEIGKASWDSPDDTLSIIDILLNKNMVAEGTSRDENKEMEHLDNNEDPQDCPPGVRVCKKTRMLKQMLKTAVKKSEHSSRAAKLNPYQGSGHVQLESDPRLRKPKLLLRAPVLDLSFWKNMVKEETSPRPVPQRATRTCPPGMKSTRTEGALL